jgi:hypothetical protein
MTHKEVETILGVKPGDYHSVAVFGVFPASNILVKSEMDQEAPEGDEETWESDEVGISVFFGPEGTVTAKYYAILTRTKPLQMTLLERIRGMLGL